MKRKYRGILAIGVAIATILGVVLYAVNFSASNKSYAKRLNAPLLDASNLPEPNIIKQVHPLSREMPGLVFPKSPESGTVNLSLFGYRTEKKLPDMPEETQTDGKEAQPSKLEYSLSFAFSSGEKKYCIVDGKFYPEGADLPNGGKIEMIRSNCILVNRHGIGKWIFVTGPKIESDSLKKKKK